ncbi:SWI/SNF complex subunit SWI3B [Glycine soja]|uniref:SWI/SNF complex subunit SWI3B n=1 Tax=Glycine soja TaxID=3848 RepID=A0A445K3C5_GLYSO|nr:SWI/SNF complex subunit SWI3B [Glycine soja]
MAYQAIQVPSSGSSSSSGFQLLNSPFGDTTYTKVFVGGLAWETQSETMRRYFDQFGEILEAVVITDKNTGRSKGYGFVTFRDPEAARRACADPTPVIDGRRANCNLASLGRPRPPLPYGRIRPASPYVGSLQPARGAYVGGFGYQQQPVSYSYQQGLVYPPYGYTTYGPEYIYPQSLYNPYMGQQYLQIYGVPGAVNTTVYPYGQVGQAIPSGHGYSAIQGYTVPGHQIVPYGGSNVNAITTSPMPAIQASYPSGMELLHQFLANHNLLFLLILLSLCKVAVLIKQLGEGANKVIYSHAHQVVSESLQMAKETGMCRLLFHLDIYTSVFIPNATWPRAKIMATTATEPLPSSAEMPPAPPPPKQMPQPVAAASAVKPEAPLSDSKASAEANVIVVPSYSRWFSWDSIDECEVRHLPEFFESASKSPRVYKYYRNSIVKYFRYNPTRKITFTDVRKTLVGDVGSIRRVFDFLETWGLINYHPSSSLTKPLKWDDKETKSDSASNTTESSSAPAKENTKRLCSGCKVVCTIACFACDKYDLTLCARCYVRGNYRVGVNSSDFRRVEISEETKTDWNEKETTNLLEAITHYSDDWKRVSQHVPGRTEKECVAHFLKLPFVDQFQHYQQHPAVNGTDDSCNPLKRVTNADAESELDTVASAEPNKRMRLTPLADASNPIMAQNELYKLHNLVMEGSYI